MVAVCSLAAAIGTLGAALALFDAMVMSPVRVDQPEQLVHVGGLAHNIPGYEADDWWAQASAFGALALYADGEASVTANGVRQVVEVSQVSKRFFDVLRHRAAAGRLLMAADARGGGARATVVSESFARRVFGSSDAAVGRELAVATAPHVVVGVVASGAEFPRVTDVWVIADEALRDAFGARMGPRPAWSGMGLGAVGRLTDAATLPIASAQVKNLLVRLGAEVTPRTGLHFGEFVRVVPLRDVLARDPQTMMGSFVVLSLLGVCLAGVSCGMLVLDEHLSRQREWAMRQALGATPGQVRRAIARQALSLAGLAAIAGIIAMYGALRLVDYVAVSSGYFVPTIDALGPGYLVVASLSAGAAAALVSVLPAMWAARVPLAPVLNDRRQHAASIVPGWAIRSMLVGTQACVGVAIIAGAGFATRDLVASLLFDRGHQPASQASVFRLRQDATDAADQIARWRAAWSAVEAVPGTSGLAMISELPVDSTGSGVWLEAAGRRVFVSRRFVRGRFDRLLGIRSASGDAVPVAGALTLSTSASQVARGSAGAGGTVRFDGVERVWPVTGVVADLRFAERTQEREAAVYVDLDDAAALKVPVTAMQLVVTCPGVCSAETIQSIGDAVRPYVEVRGAVTSLGALYERSGRPAKARAIVSNVYAALALLIVVVGVYTLSGAVVIRSAFETGMRLALGAQRTQVVLRLLSRVCTPAALGIAAGVAMTAVVVRRFSVGTPAATVVTQLTGAAALLFLTAVLAALLPALMLVRRPLVWLLRRQ